MTIKKKQVLLSSALIIILLSIASLIYFAPQRLVFSKNSPVEAKLESDLEAEAQPSVYSQIITIEPGDTYTEMMQTKSELSLATITALYQGASEHYDLAQIKAGNEIELYFNYQSNELEQVIYKINSEEQLRLDYDDGLWLAQVEAIPYTISEEFAQGEISSSFYLAGLDLGLDERVIIDYANALEWSLDFSNDPQVGDTFALIYQNRYLADAYVRPGLVLAAWYKNQGKDKYAFYFTGSNGESGYYDEEGNSVQKMFLKAPLAFKYISSGYTTGQRYISAFNISTGHRAIDYAATLGTPIRSVGDGTVSFAGWNGSYGNMVKVRHNGTYSTNYGHMSKIAVSVGQKVSQGDIIGYVGSTGLSTGPHLHYEMEKNGVKINPLTEVLPPGEPLAEEDQAEFFALRDLYLSRLSAN